MPESIIHMELVAEEFSKLSGYQLNLDLVKRIKDTKPQYNLNKTQRMENFLMHLKLIKARLWKEKFLLLDDICTTGSTLKILL